MRAIGLAPDRRQAEIFSLFMKTKSIDVEIRETDGGDFKLWVLDDKHMEEARARFEAFIKDPDAAEFRGFDLQRRVVNIQKAKDETARRIKTSKFHLLRSNYQVNYWLIGITVAVFMLQNAGALSNLTRYLYFSEDALGITKFQEIRSGQVWRLFTPILMHGGLLHLGFNLLWLYQLGSMVEKAEGTVYYVFLILFFAAFSNTCEYLWTGPNFIGVSGVIYALLGYVYVMSNNSNIQGYFMDQSTLVIMVIWLLLCITGVMGNVANATHVGGLVIGCLWGLWHAFRLKRRNF